MTKAKAALPVLSALARMAAQGVQQLPQGPASNAVRTMSKKSATPPARGDALRSASAPFQQAALERRVTTVAELSLAAEKRTPVPSQAAGPVVRSCYDHQEEFEATNEGFLAANPIVSKHGDESGVTVNLLEDGTIFATNVDSTSSASLVELVKESARALATDTSDQSEIAGLEAGIFDEIIIKNMTSYSGNPGGDPMKVQADRNLDLHMNAFRTMSEAAEELGLPEPDISVISSRNNPKLPPAKLTEQAAKAGYEKLDRTEDRKHPEFEAEVKARGQITAEGIEGERGQSLPYEPSTWTFRASGGSKK